MAYLLIFDAPLGSALHLNFRQIRGPNQFKGIWHNDSINSINKMNCDWLLYKRAPEFIAPFTCSRTCKCYSYSTIDTLSHTSIKRISFNVRPYDNPSQLDAKCVRTAITIDTLQFLSCVNNILHIIFDYTIVCTSA